MIENVEEKLERVMFILVLLILNLVPILIILDFSKWLVLIPMLIIDAIIGYGLFRNNEDIL